MDQIFKLLLSEKGTATNRGAVLLLVGWVAYTVHNLDLRMAVIEDRLHVPHAAALQQTAAASTNRPGF